MHFCVLVMSKKARFESNPTYLREGGGFGDDIYTTDS